MRPFRKIHIQPVKLNSVQIIQNRTRSPPISRFRRLVILSLILVFVVTIVVTITLFKDSTETTTVSSPIHSNFSSTSAFSIRSTFTTPIDDIESIERTTSDDDLNITGRERVTSWNLLENPGAESQLDHWMQIGDTPVIVDCNESSHSNINPYKGRSCFAGGYTKIGTRSQLLQSINLFSGINDQIDSGTLQLEISFHYQTWHHPNRSDDIIEVDVVLFTDSLNIIDRIHTGALICRISKPKWCYYRNAFPLPSGTRSIYYIMIFSKNDRIDTSLDVYIDENSLIIM